MSVNLQDDLLDAGKFREWLESKPPRSIVGDRNRAASCPLARYLKEKTGADELDVLVRAESITLLYPHFAKTLKQKDWSSDFVDRVDIQYPGDPRQRITAGAALRILKSVLR